MDYVLTPEVSLIGKSMNIRISIPEEGKLDINWDKIEEIDNLTKKVVHSITNFASVGSKSDIVMPVSDDYIARSIALEFPYLNKPPIRLELEVFVFKKSGTAFFLRKPVKYNKGDVKFNVTILDWPVSAPANTIVFGANLITNQTPKNGQSANTINVGKATLSSLSVAEGPAYEILPITTTLTNKTIQWIFPARNYIKYDPIISLTATPSSSNGSVTLWVSIAIVLFLALLIPGIIILIKSRQK